LEQNQNSDNEKDDGVGSEDTESNSEDSEDEREDSKVADADEKSTVDVAIIDKLEELKVTDQVPSTKEEK
jgi:hypothetical protein